jgi:hypothetical protein
METIAATIICSSDEPATAISSVHELDQWLERLAGMCSPKSPHIFRLCAHGYSVDLAFGLAESFVSLEHESGMPPYFTTLGDATAEGEVEFYLFGAHRTKVPRRNLIPMTQARQVVREFLETGSRSTSVRWEKASG